MKQLYNNNQEVMDIEPIIFKCKLCENEDDYSLYNPDGEIFKIMVSDHVCYHCAYWMNIIKNPPIHYEVIDGLFFEVFPSAVRPFNRIMGGLGIEYYIRRFDGTLVKSNNIHVKGYVPEHFKDKFPDTAEFMDLIEFQKLKNHPKKCPSKGCYERYNCIRYDTDLEADGPFNTVPEHEIGKYRCPQFIPHLKINKQWFIS